MDAVVGKSHSITRGEDISFDSAEPEKPPGAARSKSLSPRASQCDRESRPCGRVPFAAEWKHVREVGRRTLLTSSKGQSSTVAKAAERYFVVQFLAG